MASPHTANDMLEENGGPIAPAMFPQFDEVALATYLTRKLDDGVTRANAYPSLTQPEKDAAAFAWAAHEAFLATWRRLSTTPATAKVDGEAERTMLGSQITTFKLLADEYRKRYEAILPAQDDATGGLTIVTGVPTQYRW